MQPVSDPREPDGPDEGRFADPRIIAERRARRAELNEGTLRERALKAEGALAEARSQLAAAHDQRIDLAAQLKRAERELRSARQGEHAEAARREELEEDSAALRHEIERELAVLRAALAAEEQRVSELEDELRHVLRAAVDTQSEARDAYAQPALAVPQLPENHDVHDPYGSEAQHRALADAEAELAARLEELQLVEDSLDAGRRELASRRGGLELRLHDTQQPAGSLEEALVTEREARVRAIRTLEDERERFDAEVTLLQHELDRRVRVHEEVSRQLVEVRAELTNVQTRISSGTGRQGVTDSVLAELGSTALHLRDELQGLEDERHELETKLAAAEAAVAERSTQLAECERRASLLEDERDQLQSALQTATDELRSNNAELAQNRIRLQAAEDAVADAELRARDVGDLLQDERHARAEAESKLQMTIAEERDAFQQTVLEHRAELQSAIARERAAFESQMESVREGVVGLRDRLAQAEADLAAQNEAERAAREEAEARALRDQQARQELEERLEAERTAGAAQAAAGRERAEAAQDDLRAQLEAVGEELGNARAEAAAERERIGEATAESAARAAAAEDRARLLEEERDRLATAVETARLEVDAAQAETEIAAGRARSALAEAQAATERAEAAARNDTGEAAMIERARADVAERERDLLAEELEARNVLESEIKASLTALRAELAQVRVEADARDAREVQLEALVNELVGTAGSLRDGFEREIAAITAQREQEFADRAAAREQDVAAERARLSEQLAEMEARMAELREHLTAASQELAAQLEAERGARQAAEEQLAIERAQGRQRERSVVELENELEQARIALRPPAPMPPADHPALSGAVGEPKGEGADAAGGAGSVIIDLARAAARLRTRRDDAAGVTPDDPRPAEADDALDTPGDAKPPAELEDVSSPGEPDVTDVAAAPETRAAAPPVEAASDVPPLVEAAVDPAAGDIEPLIAEIEVPPASVEPAPPAQDPQASAVPDRTATPTTGGDVVLGARLSQIGRRTPRAWLTPAIMTLARRDVHAAASVIEALVPIQAARLQQDLTYDVVLTGHPELRVQLRADGTASVGARDPFEAPDAADFRLTGSAVSLAPYAGGGIGRRLPAGVVVAGRRRRARKLAKALRDPVSFHTLSTLGEPLTTTRLLELLALAIDPGLTKGERFTLSFAVDDGPAEAHVVVADGQPIVVGSGAPVHTAATVRTSKGQLAAFLGGEAPARISGDIDAVGTLLGWVDTVQGLDA